MTPALRLLRNVNGSRCRNFIKAIFRAHGPLQLLLSPISVAELVHGIYRSKTPEIEERRRQFVEELIDLGQCIRSQGRRHGWWVRSRGKRHSKGNIVPFNDLMIAAAAIEEGEGYAVLTGNLRHFQKVPGLTVIPF